MCLGGSDAADIARQQQQQQQQQYQLGLKQINAAYAPFNQDFYKQRQQAYVDYANPAYTQQYGQTRNQMLYGLANRGLLNSSAGQEQANALAIARNQAQQQIGNTAVQGAQQLQQTVEQQRAQLVGQLAATGDPTAAAQAAVSTAANFQAPSAFAPVGPLFQNFANTYLANQYAQAYSPLLQYYGAYSQPAYTGTAASIPGPSRVVGGG